MKARSNEKMTTARTTSANTRGRRRRSTKALVCLGQSPSAQTKTTHAAATPPTAGAPLWIPACASTKRNPAARSAVHAVSTADQSTLLRRLARVHGLLYALASIARSHGFMDQVSRQGILDTSGPGYVAAVVVMGMRGCVPPENISPDIEISVGDFLIVIRHREGIVAEEKALEIALCIGRGGIAEVYQDDRDTALTVDGSGKGPFDAFPRLSSLRGKRSPRPQFFGQIVWRRVHADDRSGGKQVSLRAADRIKPGAQPRIILNRVAFFGFPPVGKLIAILPGAKDGPVRLLQGVDIRRSGNCQTVRRAQEEKMQAENQADDQALAQNRSLHRPTASRKGNPMPVLFLLTLIVLLDQALH